MISSCVLGDWGKHHQQALRLMDSLKHRLPVVAGFNSALCNSCPHLWNQCIKCRSVNGIWGGQKKMNGTFSPVLLYVDPPVLRCKEQLTYAI